jgi:hypothetical protein
MKFLVGYKNDKGKFLVKLEFEAGKEKWATTSEAVVNYAKANFKANEDVDVEYTEKNGQYNVSRITKKGSAPAPVATTKPTPVTETVKTTEYKCTDCGATLKDGKYKKCFPCNKKNPAPKKESTGGGQRDAVGQSIEKQAMMKASAMAVGSAFVSQVQDADTLANMIITVYEKLLKKLTE